MSPANKHTSNTPFHSRFVHRPLCQPAPTNVPNLHGIADRIQSRLYFVFSNGRNSEFIFACVMVIRPQQGVQSDPTAGARKSPSGRAICRRLRGIHSRSRVFRVRNESKLTFISWPPRDATDGKGRMKGVCSFVRDVRVCSGGCQVPDLQIASTCVVSHNQHAYLYTSV